MLSLLKRVKSYIVHPHPLVVFVVLGLSIFLLAGSVVGTEERVGDAFYDHVYEGVVQEVVSEETVFLDIIGQDVVEQELLVLVSVDTTEHVVSVFNDMTPLAPGDRVYVRGSLFNGDQFDIVEVRRTGGMWILVLLFVGLVFLVSGRRGMRSLVGLVFSFAVIFSLILPLILSGSHPTSAGVGGGVLILLVTLYLAYGVNYKSVSALLGIAATLGVVGLLAHVSVQWLHLTGIGGEGALFLGPELGSADRLLGLLIAGIIIAAIGVLDDVAVTQASTVFTLAATDSTLRGMKLFHRAMVVGKDHIAAVTNTLVLAYTGAALPLLLLFTAEQAPAAFIISRELVAEEIVRTLVASTGLVLAVPLTTAIAVVLVRRARLSDYKHDTHGHSH